MSSLLPAAGTPFLYLAFAAALLGASARRLRPLSLLAAVVLVLLPLTFTGPALMTAGVYAPLDLPFTSPPLEALRDEVGLDDDDNSRTRFDVAFRLIPWRKAARHAIKNLEWPIWNPFMLAGDVLAAAGEPAVYHPIHLLSYLLPLGPSLTFIAAAFLLAAGWAAFCFHREIGCSEPAAIVGAAGWMFCDFMIFWIGWPLSQTVAFFPLLLVAVRRVVRQPGRRSAGLLTAAFVLLILAGHPESVLHCAAAGMVYGLCELAAAYAAPGPRSRRAAGAAIGVSLAAGALALLLSAVYLLPVLEAAPQTYQYHLRRGGSPASASWPVVFERLRLAVVPFAHGVPWSEWIRTRFGAEWSAYPGSVLLAPALLGLWRGPWRGRWLMLGFAVFGILAWVAAPFPNDLLARLPLFDVAINRRLVFLAGFALSVLSALGCETWIREPRSRRLAWLGLATLVALGAAIAGFWPGMRDAGLSADFLRSRTWLELAPAALATGLFFTVALVRRSRSGAPRSGAPRSGAPARLGVAGLLVLLLVQRWTQTSELNPTYDESLFYPPVAELEALPRDGPPYRVVGRGSCLAANISALYELEDARGHSPLTHRRLLHVYRRLVESGRYPTAAFFDLGRPFLSFLNVRFAVVREGWAPADGWKPFVEGRSFAVYENTRVLERAFVPERVRIGEPVARMDRDMEAATDFSRLAWVHAAEPGADLPAGEHANGPGRVTVERRGLGLHLEVEMDRPGWVVVSQTAWKGWRATADGREIPLQFANHAFLGFHLSAGRHPVDLVYRPRSFVIGRATSFLTAGAVAIFWLGAAARRRRLGE